MTDSVGWGPGVRAQEPGTWGCLLAVDKPADRVLGVSFVGLDLRGVWSWRLVLPGANRPRSCLFLHGRFSETAAVLPPFTSRHGAVYFLQVWLILAAGKSAGLGSARSAEFVRFFSLVHGSVEPEPVYA